MWTVTHTHNILLPALSSTTPSTTGDWRVPDFGPSYAGVGPVITVSPSYKDGGIPDDTRPAPEASRPATKVSTARPLSAS
jgi:hypothetical protein